jgi:hypothetical protein
VYTLHQWPASADCVCVSEDKTKSLRISSVFENTDNSLQYSMPESDARGGGGPDWYAQAASA